MDNYQFLRNRMQTFVHGLVIWKVMQRSAWKDIANWWTKQLNSYTKSQHHAWMTINSKNMKLDLLENCEVCLKIVLRYLYLARIGRPDILWSVNKLARAVTKWIKRPARFDLVHSSHKWIPTILLFGEYSTTMQIRIVSRFWFCWRSGRLEVNIRGTSVCIFGSQTFVPISRMCKKQTAVSHSSMEAEIISLGRYSRSYSLGFWWLKCFIPHQTRLNNPRKSYEETRCRLPSQTCTTSPNASTPTSFQLTLTTFHPTHYILVLVPCCMSLYTMRPWLRWLSKVEVPRWDMFHGPTELLWIGCLTGLIWTQKFKIDTSIASINSQTS